MLFLVFVRTLYFVDIFRCAGLPAWRNRSKEPEVKTARTALRKRIGSQASHHTQAAVIWYSSQARPGIKGVPLATPARTAASASLHLPARPRGARQCEGDAQTAAALEPAARPPGSIRPRARGRQKRSVQSAGQGRAGKGGRAERNHQFVGLLAVPSEQTWRQLAALCKQHRWAQTARSRLHKKTARIFMLSRKSSRPCGKISSAAFEC